MREEGRGGAGATRGLTTSPTSTLQVLACARAGSPGSPLRRSASCKRAAGQAAAERLPPALPSRPPREAPTAGSGADTRARPAAAEPPRGWRGAREMGRAAGLGPAPWGWRGLDATHSTQPACQQRTQSVWRRGLRRPGPPRGEAGENCSGPFLHLEATLTTPDPTSLSPWPGWFKEARWMGTGRGVVGLSPTRPAGTLLGPGWRAGLLLRVAGSALGCNEALRAFYFCCYLCFWGLSYLLDVPHGSGILVLRPGEGTPPSALEAPSLSHWTSKEVLATFLL